MNAEYFTMERGSSTSPSETPFQTPLTSGTMRTPSRNTSASIGISPGTPPAMPPLDGPPFKDAPTNGPSPNFPQTDFTPSLHASLVSEILSLRRDATSKHETIEELESALSLARGESDVLRENAARGAKETRALKRQLQMHEDGSYSTMELLCKERDDVNEVNAELRKKIETLQRKGRSQDEDSRRIYKKLDLDKSKWEKERRLMERRVNVAESRLKAILAEFASREIEAEATANQTDRTDEGGLVNDKDSVASFDIHASPVRKGNASIGSIRDLQKSLAEELDFNDDDDTAVEPSETSWFNDSAHDLETARKRPSTPTDSNGESRPQNPPSTPPARASKPVSHVDQPERTPRSSVEGASRSPESTRRQSKLVSEMVKRFSVASLPSDEPRRESRSLSRADVDAHPEILAQEELQSEPPLEDEQSDQDQTRTFEPTVAPIRRHNRVQSDPSHRLDKHSHAEASSLPRIKETSQPNQPSDRISFAEPEPSQSQGVTSLASSATQTDPVEFRDDLQSVPNTVETLGNETMSVPPAQTTAPGSATVPAIAVQPATAPPSPDSSNSHTGMADASCQTMSSSFLPMAELRSVGVQTDRIRIDKRLIKWPAHLRSLSQTEKLSVITEPQKNVRVLSPVPEASRGNESVRSAESAGMSDHSTQTGLPSPTYQTSFAPELNDAGSETSRWSRRPISKVPSITSDTPRLEFDDVYDDAYMSDAESHIAIAKPLNWLRKQQRQTFDPPMTVPEYGKVPSRPLSYDRSSISTKGRPAMEKGKGVAKNSFDVSRQPSLSGPGKKLGSITQHSRSPSFGSVTSSSISKSSGPRPPFVIPLRVSSRKVHSRSSRSDAQTSPTRSRRGNRSPPKTSRPAGQIARQPTLRKSHSAAAVGLDGKFDSPYLNTASAAQYGQSKEHSPPKKDALKSPRTSHVGTRPMVSPTGNASVDMSAQHNVVDAITATMIGEWMWKYIRKGKSFGVQEDGQEIVRTKNNDVRHKRWVWLSPYEKVVMWSSKQPTSNAALMGKAGRKLSIQSVLDVKDITPPPKGVSSAAVFSRSILVLTPARALKFTAPTHERHYLWLTALSFLAHGGATNNILNLPSPPPLMPFVQQESAAHSNSGRSSAASFLRVKSSKNGSQVSSGHATPVVHEMEAMVHKFGPKPSQVPDTAFAPTVPRVPHSRKRSVTGPSRSRAGFLPGSLRSGSSSQAPTPRTGTGRSRSKSRVESSKSFKAFDTDYDAMPMPVPLPVPSINPLTQNPAPSYAPPPPPSQAHTNNLILHPSNLQSTEPTPRPSGVSVEGQFGGNSNFFDAVGVVRMSAFSKPGVDLALTDPATGAVVSGNAESRAGHQGKNSEESFVGPPDIARSRGRSAGVRRVGGFGF
ncbi:MAG: hypothetical protein M1828_003240 [Chrysothrix sp. TS-e1954]|nr:MAG: hypothetical protein M1828_003240 [Chrysothrix sp. TS-e1954]